MKRDHWILIGLGLVVLYLLFMRRPSSGASAGAGASGGGLQLDPWSQRIDAATDAVTGLWNIFGGGASSSSPPPPPSDTTYA